MPDQNEGTLVYNCAETSRLVWTGIATDTATLSRLDRFHITLWCPHCGTVHALLGKEAWLAPSYRSAWLRGQQDRA
jgi:hypothetical protein